MGIIALGIVAFFLAVMQASYDWDIFFTYLFRDHANLLYGFVISLIIAAIFKHVYTLLLILTSLENPYRILI